MTRQFLEKKFRALGARLLVEEAPSTAFAINVGHDSDGEYFQIRKSATQDVENIVVVDLQPAERHLLLLVDLDEQKQKFLCGHDARHWFVTAVPDLVGVASVNAAREAIKPVMDSKPPQIDGKTDEQPRVPRARAYRRQGEWFFIPAPTLKVSAAWMRLNEPLRRSVESKPHIMQYCVRLKGETVHVCDRYPNGLREAEYERLIGRSEQARQWNWQVRTRSARVYAKGRVRHPDHKTITLQSWHRVVLNPESESLSE